MYHKELWKILGGGLTNVGLVVGTNKIILENTSKAQWFNFVDKKFQAIKQKINMVKQKLDVI